MGDVFGDLWANPAVVLTRNLLILFYIVFHFALTFWTIRDASRRGAMSGFWGVAVLIFGLAGWAIYQVVRPPELAADIRERDLEIRAKEIMLQRDLEICPACYKPVEKDFLICPYCMKKLRNSCTECQKPLKLNWGVCPYCKVKQ